MASPSTKKTPRPSSTKPQTKKRGIAEDNHNNNNNYDDDNIVDVPGESFGFEAKDIFSHNVQDRTVGLRIPIFTKTKKKKKKTSRTNDDNNNNGTTINYKETWLGMNDLTNEPALSEVRTYLQQVVWQKEQQRTQQQQQQHATTDDDETDESDLTSWIDHLELQLKQDNFQADEIDPATFAFCCFTCKCPEDHKNTIAIASSSTSLWHRWCCHNIRKSDASWKSPTDRYQDHRTKLLFQNIINDAKPTNPLVACSLARVQERLLGAKQSEGKYNNATQNPDSCGVWYTNTHNQEFAAKFRHLSNAIQNGITPKPNRVVVVDLFSGISTFLVAMKRIGIKIDKMIHVDHDLVAAQVSKFNHSNDGIEHVYINKFEDISGPNFDKFMKEVNEPIDIIVGGPPCQDYTTINADRAGVEGEDGKYMLQVGAFIRKVQNHQKDHPLWFLIENVIITGDDLNEIVDAFGGITPVQVDSYHFSPCNRNRNYFVNFPVNVKHDDRFELQARCDDCLDDGFMLPQSVCRETDMNSNWSKANTFMASISRLDDDRMMVVKKQEQDEFLVRTFNVKERERMMGLPNGYVSAALSPLFEHVTRVMLLQSAEHQDLWFDILPEQFHCLQGEKFRLHHYPETQHVDLAIAPPINGNDYPKSFYMEEQYAKRLIGNSISVSVVELLLQPLTELFPSTNYEGYDYKFSWLVNDDSGSVNTDGPVDVNVMYEEPSDDGACQDDDDNNSFTDWECQKMPAKNNLTEPSPSNNETTKHEVVVDSLTEPPVEEPSDDGAWQDDDDDDGVTDWECQKMPAKGNNRTGPSPSNTETTKCEVVDTLTEPPVDSAIPAAAAAEATNEPENPKKPPVFKHYDYINPKWPIVIYTDEKEFYDVIKKHGVIRTGPWQPAPVDDWPDPPDDGIIRL